MFCLLNQVYWAIEDNDCCTRNCFGSVRPYDMKVMDAYQNEVIHFYRPLACSSCCFPCCLQSIEVTSSGQLLGRVEQEWTLCYPHYSIKNHNGETVLRIEGPLCKFSCGGDVDFNVRIQKKNPERDNVSFIESHKQNSLILFHL